MNASANVMRWALQVAGWSARAGISVAALLLGVANPSSATAQTAPSPFTQGTRYDVAGRVVGTIAPDPDASGPLHFAAVRNTYDLAGRLTKVEKGELASWQDETVAPAQWASFTTFTIFQTIDTTYDDLGRKTSEKLSSGGTPYALTQYSYDNLGRLECTAVRMNPAIYGSLPASACTLGTAGDSGNDRITRNVYDLAGQVLGIQKAYASPRQQDYATYTYTDNGKVKTMTDANGNKASMTYDGFDRQTQWNFPDKVTVGAVSSTDYEAYTYDAAGNRLSLRKRDGSVITYSYDALNRMSVKDIPGGTSTDVYYGYDLRGLQLYARFVSGSGLGITNTYDGFGRLTSTTNDMGTAPKTLSYQWDANGNRTRITHPDSVYFTYDYDGLDRAVVIKESGATMIVTDIYDAQGRRASQTRGAVTTTYAYDPISRLSGLTDDLASTASDVTTGFSYNPASQIVSKSRSNDLYAFTGYPVSPVSRNYAVNGLNQYSTAGPATFTYDANGNLTSDGTITYTYDAENRMVTASGPTAATLKYDPQGRLWRIVMAAGTVELGYDGDAMVSLSTGPVFNRFVHGNGEDDPLIWYRSTTPTDLTDRRSLQADQQGSIVSMADASGAPLWIDSYDEYGIPGAGNAGVFQYTGQFYAPWIGLYYYKARMYSPTLGRFLQTDPIGYDDQVNLYAYVANDPLNRSDPSGMEGCPPDCNAVQRFGRFIWGGAEVIVGALGVVVGAAGDGAAGAAEVGTAGVATPVTVPVAIASTTVIVGGAALATDGYHNMTGALFNDNGNGERSGGGKNAQKSNPDRVSAGQQRINRAREELQSLRSRPNKTPADKAQISRLERQIQTEQTRIRQSENHSMKAKR